ncbi:hypothetical protein Taro_056549 [Colocasia esculenta]|uniref:Uncharacterized protein n=1 Tax=Colocasia esculenta TaxID=4460 RepID=A0A843XXQ3_COLES|nr:hypothetical protein [Colocasia esculenta]
MASQAISNYRENAEIYHGDALCKKKIAEMLKEVGLPVGLLPLEDKKKREHTFKAIKETVSYATEVTALVEPRKIKKVTGVKVRGLLLWLSVVEVYIDNSDSAKITFKTGTGLSDTFPVSAFEPQA